jgi:hypothetical protein
MNTPNNYQNTSRTSHVYYVNKQKYTEQHFICTIGTSYVYYINIIYVSWDVKNFKSKKKLLNDIKKMKMKFF